MRSWRPSEAPHVQSGALFAVLVDSSCRQMENVKRGRQATRGKLHTLREAEAYVGSVGAPFASQTGGLRRSCFTLFRVIQKPARHFLGLLVPFLPSCLSKHDNKEAFAFPREERFWLFVPISEFRAPSSRPFRIPSSPFPVSRPLAITRSRPACIRTLTGRAKIAKERPKMLVSPP